MDEEVYPVMCVLPMGWSYSPLVAQEAHEEPLGRQSQLQEDNRLRESRPWGRRRKVHFSYIAMPWWSSLARGEAGRGSRRRPMP